MMDKPKVYFMDARSESPDTSLINKTVTVFEAAGFDKMINKGDVVAIKIHCGELGSSAYIRPAYVRAIADKIKELGGRPFACDTTTQTYGTWGSRAMELDLIETAEKNGFSSATLGCPFISADGYVGTSDYRIDIPEGYLLKEAYVAQAIAAADKVIVLTHFKGHGMGVIGGALKNMGIGCQSKRGKFNVHMGRHPSYGIGDSTVFHPENFKGKEADPDWELLENCCPLGLFKVTEKDELLWEREKCINCLGCGSWMNPRGIFEPNLANFDATDIAIGDAALGVVKAVGRENIGFINVAVDVSPKCDCAGFSDLPLTPHLGVFASKDPVAIDQACVDAAKHAPGMPGSLAEEMGIDAPGERKFDLGGGAIEGLSEQTTINTAVVNGLGSRDHELVHAQPLGRERFLFPPDPRPTKIRFEKMFEKFQPFPFDKHNGRGYNRLEKVDIEAVKGHDGPTVDPHSHQDAAYHGDGGWHPGDDDPSYHPNGSTHNGKATKKDKKAKKD